MSTDIWASCQGERHIQALIATAWRVVESQEISATRKLVDSLAEQILLEDLLEASKPPLTPDEMTYHPLLYTPFRYPPLAYGSRFGRREEPALWYGSLMLHTALAEKAFYKFHFLRGSQADFGMVEERLTAFSVAVETQRGVCLTVPPFSRYHQAIASPMDYALTQSLGSAMRRAGVEAFQYASARAKGDAENIALLTPRAFSQPAPHGDSFQSWHSFAGEHTVEFVRSSAISGESVVFPMQQFLVADQLPFPAN